MRIDFIHHRIMYGYTLMRMHVRANLRTHVVVYVFTLIVVSIVVDIDQTPKNTHLENKHFSRNKLISKFLIN